MKAIGYGVVSDSDGVLSTTVDMVDENGEHLAFFSAFGRSFSQLVDNATRRAIDVLSANGIELCGLIFPDQPEVHEVLR